MMDGRMDFSIDRGRLLGTMPTGSLGALGPAFPETAGHPTATLGRSGPGPVVTCVSELSRAGTPSSITSLGQYPGRYLPPTLPHLSSGANYAMMGGFMSGGGTTAEGLKSVIPDLQQYWTTSHAEGYPRYIVNNNMYSPYLSYLPATESLSLFAQHAGAASQAQAQAQVQAQNQAYHRIYDLHKEALYSGVFPVTGPDMYGSIPATVVSSQSSRPPSPHMLPTVSGSTKQEGTSRQKPTGINACGKQESTSRHNSPGVHAASKQESASRHSDSSRRSNEPSKQSAKVSDTQSKHFKDADKKDGHKKSEQTIDIKVEPKSESIKSMNSKSKIESTVHESKAHTSKQTINRKEKNRAVVAKEDTKLIKNAQESNCKQCKDDVKITKAIVPVPSNSEKLTTKVSCSVASGSSKNTPEVKTQSVTTTSTVTVTSSECLSVTASQPLCGTDDDVPPGCLQATSTGAETSTTYSLPYYHSLFAHSNTPEQEVKKVHASTYVPEVVTLPSSTKTSQSAITTTASDTKVKTEPVRSSCCKEKQVSSSNSRSKGSSIKQLENTTKPTNVCSNASDRTNTDMRAKVTKCKKLQPKPAESRQVQQQYGDVIGVKKTDGNSCAKNTLSVCSNAKIVSSAVSTSKSLNTKIHVESSSDTKLKDNNKEDIPPVTSKSEKSETTQIVSVSASSNVSVLSGNACLNTKVADANVKDSLVSSTIVSELPPILKKTNVSSLEENNVASTKTNEQGLFSFYKESSPKPQTTSDKKTLKVHCVKNESQASAEEQTNGVCLKRDTSDSKLPSRVTERTRGVRSGSAPPTAIVCKPERNMKSSGDNKEETPTGNGNQDEHSNSGVNIPIGIAVARQRQELTTTKPEPHHISDSSSDEDFSERAPMDDTSQYSQEQKEREEFLRQQKAILANPVGKPPVSVGGGDVRNDLPANLIVTGSATGTGVAWTDDPTARHFASQWLQAPALNPASWMGQTFSMPHAVPTVPTSGTIDPNTLPFTAPAGFKLAQDSLTGQLFLLPATSLDMMDPSRLWTGFPTSATVQPGHAAPFPQFLTAQQQTPMQHHVLPQQQPERQPTMDFAFAMQQFQQQFQPQMVRPEVSKDETVVKEDDRTIVQSVQPMVTVSSNIVADATTNPQVLSDAASDQQAIDDKDKSLIAVSHPSYIPDMTITSAQPFTFPYSSPQMPFVYNPGLIPMSGMPVSVTESVSVKTEESSVQSRGTSPINPSLEEQAGLHPSESEETTHLVSEVGNVEVTEDDEEDEEDEEGEEDEEVEVDDKKEVICKLAEVVPMPVHSKQKEGTEEDVEFPVNNETQLTGQQETLNESLDPAKKNITTDTVDKEEVQTFAVTSEVEGVNTSTDLRQKVEKDTLQSRCVKNGETETEPECNMKEDAIPSSSDPLTVSINPSGDEKPLVEYNPYTDPQILQAADGLELLSALAEKRSQCVREDSTAIPDKFDTYTWSEENEKSNIPVTDVNRSYENRIKTERKKPKIKAAKHFFAKKEGISNFCLTTGYKLPQDLDSFMKLGIDGMDVIELEMRMRLGELQRRYKEKQRELSRLHPRKEREKDKDEDKLSLKRGPGRPRKRKFFSNSSDEGGQTSPKTGKKKEHPVKKKKLAEELVDRVFRRTGRAFQASSVGKKLKKSPSGTMVKGKSGGLVKRTSSDSSLHASSPENSIIAEGTLGKKTNKDKAGTKSTAANNIGPEGGQKGKTKPSIMSTSPLNPAFLNGGTTFGGKWTFGENVSAKQTDFIAKTQKKTVKAQTASLSSEQPVECGLGLLARYAVTAAAALKDTVPVKKKKRKVGEELQFTVPESDMTSNKKRKPGRPTKCSPNATPGVTETIVYRNSKSLDLLNFQELEKGLAKRLGKSPVERKIKLDGQTPLTPVFLDEEWTLRRSERIFLSEPSPQPSPQLSTKDQVPVVSTILQSVVKTKSDRAKLQKAKNIQELSQKVKRKYSKTLIKKNSSEFVFSQTSNLQKNRRKSNLADTDTGGDSDSSSDGDNLPLSALREPEPRSCVIEKEELKDCLRVLLFMEGLFYEGAVQAILPPDVYGVVLDNERGHRPHIYSQEEILKEAIIDVKPGSIRYLPEGTRVCAYWSQQFNCLYPGTVSKASPNPNAVKNLLNVEFDDGDSGRIPLDHIRMLPKDFPLVTYEPNPLLLIGKRRRLTTTSVSDSPEPKRSIHSSVSLSDSIAGFKRKGPGRPPKYLKCEDNQLKSEDEEEDDVFVSSKKSTKQTLKSDTFSHIKKKKKSVMEEGSMNKFQKQDKKLKPKEKTKVAHKKMKSFSVHKSSSQHSSTGAPLIRAAAFDYRKVDLTTNLNGDQSKDDDGSSSSDDDDDDDDDDEINIKANTSSSVDSDEDEGYSDEEEDDDDDEFMQDAEMCLPPRQLWKWSGKSTKRPGLKGKAKKEYYKSIVRGNETLMVGDCAVFLSTGRPPHLPYVGRIENLWEAWGGQMVVKVTWFYHPEEAKGGKRLQEMKGALFQSPHNDENDVQTISHKCDVLPYHEYKEIEAEAGQKSPSSSDDSSRLYYLAGTYDPTIERLQFEPSILSLVS